jgi:hypothetical protein
VVAAAWAGDATISPGVSIGKLRLGMTRAQVERVLGRDYVVNARDAGYVELAWDYSAWTVGVQQGRVVQIGTTLRSQGTAAGIGPWRTTWPRVVRAYPGGQCTINVQKATSFPAGASFPEYLVEHRGGSQTLFRLKWRPPALVLLEVVVRANFRPLPQFGPSWTYRCGGNWREAAGPGVELGP